MYANVGDIYQDKETRTIYEIVDILFHWKTRGRVIQFMSYRTGSLYVLEEQEFLEMSIKVFSA